VELAPLGIGDGPERSRGRLETLTTTGLSDFSSSGSADWVTRMTPIALVSNTFSATGPLTSAGALMPALLTSTSRWPSRSSITPMAVSTDVSSVTSSCTNRPPSSDAVASRARRSAHRCRRCVPLRSVAGSLAPESLVGSGDERHSHVWCSLVVDFSEDGVLAQVDGPGGGSRCLLYALLYAPVLSSSHWPRRPSVRPSRRFGTGGRPTRCRGSAGCSLNAHQRRRSWSVASDGGTSPRAPRHLTARRAEATQRTGGRDTFGFLDWCLLARGI